MTIFVNPTFFALASKYHSRELIDAEISLVHAGRYWLEHATLALGRVAIVYGAGTGYVLQYLSKAGMFEQIICFENNPDTIARIRGLLSGLQVYNVSFFVSSSELNFYIQENLLKIGTIIYNDKLCDIRDIDVFPDQSLEFITGILNSDAINPIGLYRKSSKIARRFLWKQSNGDGDIADIYHSGPEISIVVPAYRVAEYLEQCVESLVNQTLRDKEIIIVDDGSPDNTGEVADALASQHSCVRVIHKVNGGCASARQAGLRASNGRFVAFVDSDDWCDADMFERLFTAAALFGADIAHCGFRKVHTHSGVVENFDQKPSIERSAWYGSLARTPSDFASSYPAIWARLHRLSFLREGQIQFSEQFRRFDDIPFQFETFVRAKRAAFIDGIYYNYRIGRPEQDVAIRDRRLFIHFPIFEEMYSISAKIGRVRTERQLKIAQINSHDWAYQWIDPDIRKEYSIGASKDIFERRNLIGASQIIWLAWRLKARKGWLMLRWYLHWRLKAARLPFPVE